MATFARRCRRPASSAKTRPLRQLNCGVITLKHSFWLPPVHARNTSQEIIRLTRRECCELSRPHYLFEIHRLSPHFGVFGTADVPLARVMQGLWWAKRPPDLGSANRAYRCNPGSSAECLSLISSGAFVLSLLPLSRSILLLRAARSPPSSDCYTIHCLIGRPLRDFLTYYVLILCG